MVIMHDLECPMLSYYVIYYEKFRKVMQQTEKVALIISTLTKDSVLLKHLRMYINKESLHINI